MEVSWNNNLPNSTFAAVIGLLTSAGIALKSVEDGCIRACLEPYSSTSLLSKLEILGKPT